jgi:hypothetical protein
VPALKSASLPSHQITNDLSITKKFVIFFCSIAVHGQQSAKQKMTTNEVEDSARQQLQHEIKNKHDLETQLLFFNKYAQRDRDLSYRNHRYYQLFNLASTGILASNFSKRLAKTKFVSHPAWRIGMLSLAAGIGYSNIQMGLEMEKADNMHHSSMILCNMMDRIKKQPSLPDWVVKRELAIAADWNRPWAQKDYEFKSQ